MTSAENDIQDSDATESTQVPGDAAPEDGTAGYPPSERLDGGGGGGSDVPHVMGRALSRSWRLFRDYPRAGVPAILTVVSTIVGLLLLPASKPAVYGEPVISAIAVHTSPQVPTYLGFIARGPRLGQVVAAFKVPPNQAVTWQIDFVLAGRDRFWWRNGVDKHFAPFGGSPVIGGTITGPVDSYDALQDGYWSFSDGSQGLTLIAASRPIPGLVSLFLRSTGPDRFLATSGYNASTSLPAVLEMPPSPTALFRSEIMVRAPGLENLTGGPEIEKGIWWDWRQSGAVSATSATGIDDVARQDAENRSFEAAVAFGLSAAALAAFAVEVVGAMSDGKKVRQEPAPLELEHATICEEPGT